MVWDKDAGGNRYPSILKPFREEQTKSIVLGSDETTNVAGILG